MKRAALALLAVLTACSGPPPARVDPADYDAFFLWAGVTPPPVLARATTLYLLAGEVRRTSGFVSMRGVPKVKQAEVWLVVRVERLDWDAATTAQVLRELARWQAGGSRMAGLQIDFDSSARGLENYATFLKALRAQMPPGMQLSITGLMDWSANADPAALASLRGVVDEVVVQSYRGRATIPGYEAYLAKLARVPVPHKVALVEGGEWREVAALKSDPLFRGYVVFLVNGD